MPGDRHSPWGAVLFDLDGTLIDTRDGMRSALGAALTEVIGDQGGAALADLTLPLEAMVGSAAPSAAPAVRERLSGSFRTHYDAGMWKEAQLYPGAESCLRRLTAASVRMFVVTNKRSEAAGRLLAHFELASYFEGLVGQLGTGSPVPKAELAGRCIAAARLDPAATVVVGDSDHDALMATSWGMTFIAVTSGAGPLTHDSGEHDRLEVDGLADAATLILEGRKPS